MVIKRLPLLRRNGQLLLRGLTAAVRAGEGAGAPGTAAADLAEVGHVAEDGLVA